MRISNKALIIIFSGFALCFILFFGVYTFLNNSDTPQNTELTATTLAQIQTEAPTIESYTQPQTIAPEQSILTVTDTETASSVTFPHTVTLASTTANVIETTVPSAEEVDESTINLFKEFWAAAGYAYDAENNILYTLENPWQKQVGYSKLYDLFASFGQMVFDTVRFKFDYGEKTWMFQLWKGRYAITSGCEVGIYTKNIEYKDVDYWEGVSEEDYVGLEINLYRYDKFYFHRGPEKHWWLTGFRIGDIVYSDGLNMQTMFELKNKEMTDAFEKSIKKEMQERSDVKYIRTGDTTVTVYWGNLIDTIFPEIAS